MKACKNNPQLNLSRKIKKNYVFLMNNNKKQLTNSSQFSKAKQNKLIFFFYS